MTELAEIFKEFGTAYIAKHGEKMFSSQKRAMRDIESCQTAVMGGEVYLCKKCNEYNYSYHSCKNRSCPKCGNKESQQWLESQKEQLLAVPYFLYTPTLPHKFNKLFFTNQKELQTDNKKTTIKLSENVNNFSANPKTLIENPMTATRLSPTIRCISIHSF